MEALILGGMVVLIVALAITEDWYKSKQLHVKKGLTPPTFRQYMQVVYGIGKKS